MNMNGIPYFSFTCQINSHERVWMEFITQTLSNAEKQLEAMKEFVFVMMIFDLCIAYGASISIIRNRIIHPSDNNNKKNIPGLELSINEMQSARHCLCFPYFVFCVRQRNVSTGKAPFDTQNAQQLSNRIWRRWKYTRWFGVVLDEKSRFVHQ